VKSFYKISLTVNISTLAKVFKESKKNPKSALHKLFSKKFLFIK